jgi:hypothetical protein
MLRGTLLMTDLTKKRRILERNGCTAFTKTKFIRLLEKCTLGRTLGFSEVKVTTCFNKLRAVFEKHKFSPSHPPLPDEHKIGRG